MSYLLNIFYFELNILIIISMITWNLLIKFRRENV